MLRQLQQAVLGRALHLSQPFRRYAITKQGVVRDLGKEAWLLGSRRSRFDHLGNPDFLNGLADLHQLGGASLGMGFQLAALGPCIGFVVVIHIANQQARIRPMDDQPNVTAGPHRPEPGVPAVLQFVEAHAGVDWVHLEVEGSGLNGLLFLAREPGKAICEGVGD